MAIHAALAVLVLLGLYLLRFFHDTAQAARAAGRPVWLFGQARGRARWAAIGFRASFGLALCGPLIWMAVPALRQTDPLWSGGADGLRSLIGALLALIGAGLALAAQRAMGASWRVGVMPGQVGPLVTGGLYRISRNPVFLGQGLLLAAVALAIPALPTVLAPGLFLWSASTQIRDEEQALRAAWGAAYDRWAAGVPRWIGLPRRADG